MSASRPSLAAPAALGYRPRKSYLSALWRIVHDHLEPFVREYDSRYRPTHGALRPHVAPVLDRFLNCGDPIHGVSLQRCPDCGVSQAIPFSCKVRVCPSCSARRGEDLADALLGVLPKVPYRHVVVAIPKRMGLRERMREDPSLQRRLVQLATRMLAREMRRSVKLHRHRREEAEGALPGMIAVLQTWTDRMAWDPHVHLVVADGAWLPDGSFYPYLSWDPEHLTRCLRDSVLASFTRLGLLSPEAAEAMRSWPVDRSGFQVHVGERMEPEQREGLGQILRYQVRPPVDLVRLQYDEASGIVRYRTRKGHDLEWSHPTAFLADFCQHVPEPRAARVSYHGYLANCKGNLGPPSPPEEAGQAVDPGRGASGRRRRIPWALLVWRVWNADVERCPRCQREMVRTAVLVERVELLRLLVALRIQAPPCRPPPVPLPETPAETVQGRERWGRRHRPLPPPRPSCLPPSGDDGFSQELPGGWDAEQPALSVDWPDELSQVPPGW